MNKLFLIPLALSAFASSAYALDNPDSSTQVKVGSSITISTVCDAKAYTNAPIVVFYLSKAPNVIDVKNDTQIATAVAMFQYDGIDKALQSIIDAGGTFIGNNAVIQYKYQYTTILNTPGTYTYYDTCNGNIESGITYIVK